MTPKKFRTFLGRRATLDFGGLSDPPERCLPPNKHCQYQVRARKYAMDCMIPPHAALMRACGCNTFPKKKCHFFAKSGRGGVNGLKKCHFLALLGRLFFWSGTSPRHFRDDLQVFWVEIGGFWVGAQKVENLGPSEVARDCYYEEEKK